MRGEFLEGEFIRGPLLLKKKQGQKIDPRIKDAAFLLTVGSFLLTVELFCLQVPILAFLLTVGAFLLTVLAFFAYCGKVRLIRALRDCKQRSSTVSKKAPTVSKKASPKN